MSVPLILTILAGAATFIGAFLGVLGQKPSNRLLAFSLGFAAGILILLSFIEMIRGRRRVGEEGGLLLNYNGGRCLIKANIK